jgi:hypothetical protein
MSVVPRGEGAQSSRRCPRLHEQADRFLDSLLGRSCILSTVSTACLSALEEVHPGRFHTFARIDCLVIDEAV